MIQLKKQDYDGMIAFCTKALPNEACGLLAGRIEGEHLSIEHLYYLKNLDQSPEHFTMDPREQLEAMKDARKRGLQILGNYHSHPNSPPRPSKEDIKLALDPKGIYLILSLKNLENPVLKGYQIDLEKNVIPLALQIEFEKHL